VPAKSKIVAFTDTIGDSSKKIGEWGKREGNRVSSAIAFNSAKFSFTIADFSQAVKSLKQSGINGVHLASDQIVLSKEYFDQLKNDRPKEFEIALTTGKIVSVGVVAGVAGFYIVPVSLYSIGFTSVGPAANSIAAWWMASTGAAGVSAGSTFAWFQSLAMGSSIGTVNAILASTFSIGGVTASAYDTAQKNTDSLQK
jgi:hypothetical protein